MTAALANQSDFDRRLEWGASGIEAVAGGTVVVIVDILCFSTSVEAATSRGAAVFPYRWRDLSAPEFARSVGALLADGSDPSGVSLSPATLLGLGPGDAVVLPSPNGSTCAALAAETGADVFAACLRNAASVGAFLRETGQPVSLIACGERWQDSSLRPALEDLLGAGTVLSNLEGRPSPEARAAVAAWLDAKDSIETVLAECVSGKQLAANGLRDDVVYAGELDVSNVVPVLRDGAFQDARRGTPD